MSLNIELDDDNLPQVEQHTFTVKGIGGKVVTVVVRQAFGADLIESTRSNKTKGGVAPAEQLYALMARVTSLDNAPATLQDFRRLPLNAVQKIMREFNKINGEDPLEDSAE
jgi:hypothetical protein